MIYSESGELFVVANRVLRNRCWNGSGGRVCRHAGAAGPSKIHSLFGIAGAAWPSPSGALGQKYPWDCEIERAEIFIVRGNLPGVFLSRLRQKTHSAPRIQKEIPGNAEAGVANR